MCLEFHNSLYFMRFEEAMCLCLYVLINNFLVPGRDLPYQGEGGLQGAQESLQEQQVEEPQQELLQGLPRLLEEMIELSLRGQRATDLFLSVD